MKVLTIIGGLGVGGAEIAVSRLLYATRKNACHLVLSLSERGVIGDEIASAGIEVLHRGSGQGFESNLRRLRSFAPDIIVAHMYNAAVTSVALKPMLRNPALHWVLHHSIDDLKAERRGTKLAIKACRIVAGVPDRIVYVSDTSATTHTDIGFPSNKNTVLPNPHPLNPAWQYDRDRLRAEFGFSDENFVIGHVARAHPMKDHANLFRALELVVQRNPKARALICGSGTETLDLPNALKAYVSLLGVRHDVPAIISACDVGVLSSAFGESLPNVLIEFMAAERPCVTTNVGGSSSIVGDLGRVVPERDSAALAEGIMQMANLSQEDRQRLGAAGRERMIARYAQDTVGDQYLRLWAEALSKRTS